MSYVNLIYTILFAYPILSHLGGRKKYVVDVAELAFKSHVYVALYDIGCLFLEA